MALGPREIHLWRARLADLVQSMALFSRVLSGDEHDRAAHYRLQERDFFVLRRGLLRTILSRYVGLSADRIRFRYGPFGKPYLDSDRDGGSFGFSLSRARDIIVCAVARGRALGIDVEYIESRPELEALGDQFLSRSESEAIRRRAGKDARLIAFYRGWTRQEALLKASGDGLTRAPLTIESTGDAGRWRVERFVPAPGYLGALVSEGRPARLRVLDWPTNGSLSGSS